MTHDNSSPAPSKKISEDEEKKIDRIADDAATKASETEEKYDEDHSIFTK